MASRDEGRILQLASLEFAQSTLTRLREYTPDTRRRPVGPASYFPPAAPPTLEPLPATPPLPPPPLPPVSVHDTSKHTSSALHAQTPSSQLHTVA